MKKEPTFQDYIDIIIEHRVLVIAAVVLVTLVAIVWSFTTPKVYEARVKFKLDLSEAKPMFFTEIYSSQRIDPVESELEIIRSHTLARTVAKKLGLNFIVKNHNGDYFDSVSVSEVFPPGRYIIKFDNSHFSIFNKDNNVVGIGQVGALYNQDGLRFLVKSRPKPELEFRIPEIEKFTDGLMESFSASQIKNTDLVLLKARTTSPYKAANMANTLAQEYINFSLSVIREAARGSKEFIESQIKTFGTELDTAEENLRLYKEKTGIIQLDRSATEIISSLAEFDVEKQRAIVELHEIQSSIDKMEGDLSKDDAAYGAYKTMASFPTLSRSPIIASLKEQLRDLEIQRQELARDPSRASELVVVQSKIKNAEQDLKTATEKIMAAGPTVGDPIFQSIISNILTNETRVFALQSRIDALEQIINRQNYKLKQLPEAEVNLAQLERQRTANAEIYQMLLGKLEESKITESMQISKARIIDYANLPDRPVAPKKSQNAILGFLLGLILGVGGAFLMEYLNTSFRSAKEIEDLTGISVLASIPMIKDKDLTEIPTIHEPHSNIAEAYRILRTNINFTAAARPIKTLLITSTLPQEGKTTTCINLAITMAQQGLKVILLDCDFRRPMLHQYFKSSSHNNNRGLSDVLVNRLKLKEAIETHPNSSSFDFVTSGTIPSNPSELLSSQKMQNLLEELKKDYDFILIDAPPALGVSDSRILGKISDGIIVVIMAGKTNRDAALEVKEELERAGEKIIGFVLNGVDLTNQYYRHRYYYYYHYDSQK
jgi:tyrosine-protein kinase Etk/Wzc